MANPLTPSGFRNHKNQTRGKCCVTTETTNHRKKNEQGNLVFYPDWITEEEEHQIINLIEKAPSCAWVHLKTRSLQNWGGEVKGEKNVVVERTREREKQQSRLAKEEGKGR